MAPAGAAAVMAGLAAYVKQVSPFRALAHAFVTAIWLALAVMAYEGVRAVQEGASAVQSMRTLLLGFNPTQVDEFSRVQKIVRDLLSDLRERTEADRAVFVMLHNGKSSLGGVPFLSVSGFAEAYGAHHSSAVHHFVDLPLPEVYGVDATLKGETLVYRPNDYREGEIVSSVGVDRVVRGGVIRAFNGIPHGWIFLGYTETGWAKRKDRHDKIVATLDRYTAIVTGVLNATSISEMIESVENHRQLR